MASILKGAPVVAAMNERNAALCEQLKAKGRRAHAGRGTRGCARGRSFL